MIASYAIERHLLADNVVKPIQLVYLYICIIVSGHAYIDICTYVYVYTHSNMYSQKLYMHVYS